MAFFERKEKVKVADDVVKSVGDPIALLQLAANSGLNTDPLDLPGLVRLLGISLFFKPMQGDESGCIKKDKKTGKWEMTVNSLHHPHRQRFTIAHELAHFICHGMHSDEFVDRVFFRNGETNRLEIEANSFAGELLMPEEQFRRFVVEVSAKIEDLAVYFQVSAMAVRIRAKVLGYEGHNL